MALLQIDWKDKKYGYGCKATYGKIIILTVDKEPVKGSDYSVIISGFRLKKQFNKMEDAKIAAEKMLRKCIHDIVTITGRETINDMLSG